MKRQIFLGLNKKFPVFLGQLYHVRLSILLFCEDASLLKSFKDTMCLHLADSLNARRSSNLFQAEDVKIVLLAMIITIRAMACRTYAIIANFFVGIFFIEAIIAMPISVGNGELMMTAAIIR